MTTIKSYTDIPQSKKLAKILPIESADNVIVSFGSREGRETVVMPKETLDVIRTPFDDIRETTMCWSLAALLDLCPTINGKQPILTRGKLTSLWYCYYEDEIDTQTYDNPIDACYELILKLNELNLL